MPPKQESDRVKVGDLDVTDYSYPNLLRLAMGTMEDLKGMRKERNKAQIQRDDLRRVWDVTILKLEETKAKITLMTKDLEDFAKEPDLERKWASDETTFYRYDLRHRIQMDWKSEKAEQEAEKEAWDEQPLLDLLKKKSAPKQALRALYKKNANDLKEKMNRQNRKIEEIDRVESGLSKELMEKERKRFTINNEKLLLNDRVSKTLTEEYLQLVLNDLEQSHGHSFTEVKNFFREKADNDIRLIEVLRLELDSVKAETSGLKKVCDVLITNNRRLEEKTVNLKKAKWLVELKRENARKEKERNLRMWNSAQKMRREAEASYKEAELSGKRLEKARTRSEGTEQCLAETHWKTSERMRESVERWNEELRQKLEALHRKKDAIVKAWAEKMGEEEARSTLEKRVGPEAIQSALEECDLRTARGATAKKAHDNLSVFFDTKLYPEASPLARKCVYGPQYIPPYTHYNMVPLNILEPILHRKAA